MHIMLDMLLPMLARGALPVANSVDHQTVRRKQGAMLVDSLAQLTCDERRVIILRHLEGLTFPEISARIGHSIHSVKRTWAQALARLGGLSSRRSATSVLD